MEHAQERQPNSSRASHYRFRLFQERNIGIGKYKKVSVGMAYVSEGQKVYMLRFWALAGEKFYLVPSKLNLARYVITTRAPNQNPMAPLKYLWKVVGGAEFDPATGFIKMDFDLFKWPIFMDLYPVASEINTMLPEPRLLDIAA